MEKEQEAIEYLKKQMGICLENAEICDENDFDEEATYLREESYMLETVLNMLKEKDKEIEYYKKQKKYDMHFRHELLEQIRCLNLNKDEKEKEIKFQKDINKIEKDRHKKTEKSLKGQIIKNNKIIEKLEKEAQRYFEENIKKDKIIYLMTEKIFQEGIIWDDKEDVKQYFKSKAEKE